MDQNHEGFLGEEHVYGSNLRNQEVISAARARGFPLLQGIPWHRKSTGHCGQYTNVCSVLGNKVGKRDPDSPGAIGHSPSVGCPCSHFPRSPAYPSNQLVLLDKDCETVL